MDIAAISSQGPVVPDDYDNNLNPLETKTSCVAYRFFSEFPRVINHHEAPPRVISQALRTPPGA